MWSVIEKAREEGKAALERIQNRQPEEDDKGKKGGMDKQKGLPSGKKTNGSNDDKADESDDGGFFEED